MIMKNIHKTIESYCDNSPEPSFTFDTIENELGITVKNIAIKDVYHAVYMFGKYIAKYKDQYDSVMVYTNNNTKIIDIMADLKFSHLEDDIYYKGKENGTN